MDDCARAADREACLRLAGEPEDPWNKGEQSGVHLLQSVTGEECEITGGYEERNEDVEKLLKEGDKTVSITRMIRTSTPGRGR